MAAVVRLNEAYCNIGNIAHCAILKDYPTFQHVFSKIHFPLVSWLKELLFPMQSYFESFSLFAVLPSKSLNKHENSICYCRWKITSTKWFLKTMSHSTLLAEACVTLVDGDFLGLTI